MSTLAALTTLIVTFATPSGTIVQAHRYTHAADCATVASMLDSTTNPLGEPMTAQCVADEGSR